MQLNKKSKTTDKAAGGLHLFEQIGSYENTLLFPKKIGAVPFNSQ